MGAGAVTIEARRLGKSYGEHLAVDELSFQARQGDVVGLLGPNGSGKTTTIRLLTTMVQPTAGEFSVAGIAGTRPADIRRHIGVLPENAGYPEHQTGQEYLRYFARLFGIPRRDAASVAARLLAQVGLDERAGSRISTYSRGMRQRLGIARALLNEPDVVFLDEPTLGLDPAGQRQMLAIVRDIARRGQATVVLSTHALAEVEEVCTSVLILDRGRIVVSGTTAEVIRAVDVQRIAEVRVPADLVTLASEALTGVPGLTVDVSAERPGVLAICLSDTPDSNSDGVDAGMNAALQAVLGTGVAVLSFEVEGTRLADAFLAVTGAGAR